MTMNDDHGHGYCIIQNPLECAACDAELVAQFLSLPALPWREDHCGGIHLTTQREVTLGVLSTNSGKCLGGPYFP